MLSRCRVANLHRAISDCAADAKRRQERREYVARSAQRASSICVQQRSTKRFTSIRNIGGRIFKRSDRNTKSVKQLEASLVDPSLADSANQDVRGGGRWQPTLCLPLRATNPRSPVRVHAHSNNRAQSLRVSRCLDSPLHAARFVRLIPFEKDLKLGGERCVLPP